MDIPQDYLRYGAIALAVVILIVVISLFLPKKDPADALLVLRSCGSCGWNGRASRFIVRCPKCGSNLTPAS
jgi:hypothetical protein